MIYMVLGGYIAVAYNDAIKSMIMIFGLVVFPIYGLVKIGGYNVLLETLYRLNPAHIDPFFLGAGVIIGFAGSESRNGLLSIIRKIFRTDYLWPLNWWDFCRHTFHG